MSKKVIHITNISLGLIIFGGISLYVVWLNSFFSGIFINPFEFPFILTLLAIWLVTYLLQLRFFGHKSFLIILFVELLLVTIIFIQKSQEIGISYNI